jgi:phage terminase small subunit
MDPITLAIVTAIAAGAASGLSKVTEQAVVDGYNALKELIKRKFGADSRLVRAVQDVEDEPDSQGAPVVLQEQVAKAQVVKDDEILQAAQSLLDAVKAQPGGAQTVQNVIGNFNAVAGSGGTATVNVNVPPSKE